MGFHVIHLRLYWLTFWWICRVEVLTERTSLYRKLQTLKDEKAVSSIFYAPLFYVALSDRLPWMYAWVCDIWLMATAASVYNSGADMWRNVNPPHSKLIKFKFRIQTVWECICGTVILYVSSLVCNTVNQASSLFWTPICGHSNDLLWDITAKTDTGVILIIFHRFKNR